MANRPRTRCICAVTLWLAVSACSRPESPAIPPDSGAREPARSAAIASGQLAHDASDAIASSSGTKCVVLLHGKGGSGRANATTGNILYVSPAGNGAGWCGREWIYFPDERYQEMRTSIA